MIPTGSTSTTRSTELARRELLYKVVGRFAGMHDLDMLSNHDMGYVFEDLIRKFAEDSNETPVSTSPRARSSG